MDFSNKTALITGGSSGIGLKLGNELHRLGANIILVARREHLLKAACDNLNAVRKNSATYYAADLSFTAGIHTLISKTVNAQVDILVNNAGFGSFGRIELLDSKREEQMITLNCIAPVLLSQTFIPQMKVRGSGTIINLSSLAGLQPLPYMATYAATKAFDYSFSLALRGELNKFGINVITVCPGPVETEFAGVARVPGDVTGAKRDPVGEVVDDILNGVKRYELVTVPGSRGRLLRTVVSLLPFRFRLWLMEKVLNRTLTATIIK